MSDSVTLIARYLPSIVCFAAAGYLASKGMSGWGWFLFVGVLAL